MTAIKLPGQLELPVVINHKRCSVLRDCDVRSSAHSQEIQPPRDVQLAKLLVD